LDNVLADTGFLVALGRREDMLHAHADRFLRSYRGRMFTAAPVIVEACFFLTPRAKCELLEWAAGGTLGVVEVPASAYGDIARTIAKYARRDLDLADAALVWLSER
jgi:predicted nucleic acid-binding protein